MSSIRLGEIGKISMCKRILKSQTNEFSGIPFYKISTFGGTPTVYIDEKIYREYKEKYSYPKKGDILISAAGTIGKTVIFDGEDSYFQDSNIVWIENDESKVTNQFLYYFLQTNPFITTNGSTIKRLYNDNLRDTKIPNVPSIQQQNQITDILGALDKKIQINNQINQELEAMAKTLYDYWFVQFDFPDQNGKPYKSSGGKMVYNPELKREIPERWGVEKLGELIQLERGVTYAKSDIVEKTTNDAIGVLRATNITRNVMDLNDLVYLTKDKINNKQIIKQNETLIVMSSGSKEHLGKNAINYYEEVIGFGAFCSKIVPQKYSAYINTFLQSSEFKCYLLKQSMGTNINNLTNSDILDCRIILPNEEILDKFENMVEKNIKLISNNYIQNQELTQLRDWLLPMLMNGQVKVENYTD
ncbi:restriction endonuclease subunit S [Streptococcus oralis]|uniref:restriction endonuclease subunit S n=1 Tax=Streptococcus oralis TaxID=1303 RepID=UPI003EE3C0B0